MSRGHLRVYLGAAAGVGKTFAMLDEGRRRRDRGTDLVVGLVETHGRARTAAAIGDLEVVPRRAVAHRGVELTELDLPAVLARAPQVALVDELAHTNAPGSEHAKRWQDVEQLLEAGIDVITTLNVQHLESLNDVVEKITGVPQRETVPDAVVRAADQIELVDSSPESLRRRMAHGNIYPPDRVEAAMANYFRVGNLSALRELALLWLADRVEEGLQRYREAHGIAGSWASRERVVVAVTGGPESETLIRRAARIAARSSGGDLLALHVARSDGLAGPIGQAGPQGLDRLRTLVHDLGGSYHQVLGDDMAEALLSFARAENATQLVLGVSRRSGVARRLTGPGIGSQVIRGSGDIDVHMVTHAQMGRRFASPRSGAGSPPGLTRQRQLAGLLCALLLLPLLTLLLHRLSGQLNLASNALAFLLGVVGIALIGGTGPAVLSAISAALLLNYFFIAPVHTFTIGEQNNLLALAVFLLVAVAVSWTVDLAARRTRQMARAVAEARTLSWVVGAAGDDDPLTLLLDRVREVFGMTSATLLERAGHARDSAVAGGGGDSDRIGTGAGPDRWTVVTSSGQPISQTPEQGDVDVEVGARLVLVLRGRTLPADDRRILAAFATQAASALEQQRLAVAAAQLGPLTRVDRTRTALLAAVGHDLRRPLASAKTAVSTLRSGDVAWSAEDTAELLATAEESLDQLARLVDNLLDLSRLQAGVIIARPRPAGVDDVVAAALAELGEPADPVLIEVPEQLPDLLADAELLQRVLANLISNAIRHSPPGLPPRIRASSHADRVELRVVDRGAGVPAQDRERIFTAFQRLGDTDNSTGLGLGLALSRGLTEAMGGTLAPEDTPGGGLTMTVTLPAAASTALPDSVPEAGPASDPLTGNGAAR
jgi:two-component system, OmpR family, sensor histidine kinase KdpD